MCLRDAARLIIMVVSWHHCAWTRSLSFFFSFAGPRDWEDTVSSRTDHSHAATAAVTTAATANGSHSSQRKHSSASSSHNGGGGMSSTDSVLETAQLRRQTVAEPEGAQAAKQKDVTTAIAGHRRATEPVHMLTLSSASGRGQVSSASSTVQRADHDCC